MKSNKLLLGLLVVSTFISLSGCSSSPEKPVDNKIAEKIINEKSSTEKVDVNQASLPIKTKVDIPTSVLPPGPITPNPYLQNLQKINPQVDISFHDAVASMQQKNWDHAEAVLKHLAEKNPKLSGIYLNLGIVYRNRGDKEKAATEFNRAINANTKNVDAYNQLAVLKRETGDFSAAENLYQKALGVWPFYPDGHKNIAILYDLYLNKPDQALPHYQAYQQLMPAPDKQVDSWIADLQRRVNPGKTANEREAK